MSVDNWIRQNWPSSFYIKLFSKLVCVYQIIRKNCFFRAMPRYRPKIKYEKTKGIWIKYIQKFSRLAFIQTRAKELLRPSPWSRPKTITTLRWNCTKYVEKCFFGICSWNSRVFLYRPKTTKKFSLPRFYTKLTQVKIVPKIWRQNLIFLK